MNTLPSTVSLLGFYRKSFLAIVFSAATTGLAGFTLLEIQPLLPANPVAVFNQPISTGSNLLLLPLVLAALLVMLISFWICVSLLSAAGAVTMSHLGYRVNLHSFSKSLWCAPSARKLLLRTVTTTILAATSISPAFASETTTPAEDLHWGTTTTVPSISPTAQPTTSSTSSDNTPSETTNPTNTTPESTPATSWTVREGDCLWDIAASQLASTDASKINEYWHQIWKANAEIIGSNPNLILPGQVLTLPSTHTH